MASRLETDDPDILVARWNAGRTGQARGGRGLLQMSEVIMRLALLLVWGCAVSVSGQTFGPDQKAYAETSQRGNARIFYWGGNRSVGQLTIDYGQPPWKENYEAFLTKATGRRWRFGQNHWTNLDTNIDLTVGKTKVPAGHYFVVLENHPERGLQMVLLDPVGVRKRKLDSYHAHKTRGGLEVPLQHTKGKKPAGQLRIVLKVDPAQNDRATLVVAFGGHRLRAPVVMHVKK